jgi:hypothetical protein
MKAMVYGTLLVLLALLSLPTTSDAFSRRSSGSEVAPFQATTSPVNTTTNNVSAQSVPEPPILLLMSIGLGVFASAYAVKRFRKQY